MKESHPLKIAEYNVAIDADHKLGFSWWVLHTLKKHVSVIAIVMEGSLRYLRLTHKFGIKCTQTIGDLLELNKHKGNTKWADTISKEIKNFQVEFEPIE